MKYLVVLFLSLSGCSIKYIYASDRYMNNVIDMCDGKVQSFKPRAGEAVCK